jgi:hypothetical protein
MLGAPCGRFRRLPGSEWSSARAADRPSSRCRGPPALRDLLVARSTTYSTLAKEFSRRPTHSSPRRGFLRPRKGPRVPQLLTDRAAFRRFTRGNDMMRRITEARTCLIIWHVGRTLGTLGVWIVLDAAAAAASSRGRGRGRGRLPRTRARTRTAPADYTLSRGCSTSTTRRDTAPAIGSVETTRSVRLAPTARTTPQRRAPAPAVASTCDHRHRHRRSIFPGERYVRRSEGNTWFSDSI